jgi:hypothetical protein
MIQIILIFDIELQNQFNCKVVMYIEHLKETDRLNEVNNLVSAFRYFSSCKTGKRRILFKYILKGFINIILYL